MAIEQTGAALGVRESRRIRGIKTLDAKMVLGAMKQSDAIGHGFWMIDIHDPKGTGYTTWNDRGGHNMLTAGESYHIPLTMCLNEQVPNLAVAGRCASSRPTGSPSARWSALANTTSPPSSWLSVWEKPSRAWCPPCPCWPEGAEAFVR